jgi:SAM-dependent methyltransferase
MEDEGSGEGIALDKARYDKLFRTYLSYTDEKEVLASALLKAVKPRKAWTFLDVGCGSGEITIPIARKVSHAVAFDINGYVLGLARRKAHGLDTIEFLEGDWTRINNIGEFDFVLASHALYSSFFRGQLRGSVIKLLGHVKPGGYLAIIHFHETGDEHDLVGRFWKKFPGTKITKKRVDQDHRYIIKLLNGMGYAPREKILRTSLVIPSVKKALFLTEWVLGVPYEDLPEALQREVLAYFKGLVRNGKVVFTSHHSLIVVRKADAAYK